MRGCEGIKPGWVRVNLNYFISEAMFDFVVEAVHMVANHGYRLVPDYRFDAHTGAWQHREGKRKAKMRLGDLSYRSGKLEFRARMLTEPEWALPSYLEAAKRIFDAAPARFAASPPKDPPPPSEDFESLRWFAMPGEVAREMLLEEDGRAAAMASASL